MALKDVFGKMFSVPSEDDYEDEYYEESGSVFDDDEVAEEEVKPASTPKATKKSDFGGLFSKASAKTEASEGSQIQVVLVKPTSFEEATEVAKHLCQRKTVVLNLETANRETSRRLLDFLAGTAFAVGGNIKRVANSTYIIAPGNVNLLGELIGSDIAEAGESYFG